MSTRIPFILWGGACRRRCLVPGVTLSPLFRRYLSVDGAGTAVGSAHLVVDPTGLNKYIL